MAYKTDCKMKYIPLSLSKVSEKFAHWVNFMLYLDITLLHTKVTILWTNHIQVFVYYISWLNSDFTPEERILLYLLSLKEK